MTKIKKNTAGQVTVWDELVGDTRPYIIGKHRDCRGDSTFKILVRDGKAVKASDVKLTKEEHERLRRCSELFPVVAAELEKMLTEGQSDDVREARRNKLWQFAGLMSELTAARSSVTIINRIRSGKGIKGVKTKTHEWHAIAFKLATPVWRDHQTRKPTTIAKMIEGSLNKELAALERRKTLKTETIADYLRDNEDQIKNTG